MAKVVTSQGLQDFVSTAQPTETFTGDATQRAAQAKLALAKKLEAVDSPASEPPKPDKPSNVVELSAKEPEAKGDTKTELDDGLEAEDHDLADRAKKRIGKKHYEMKKAQEEAKKAREEAEADQRLAENLFNEREMYKRRAEELEKQVQQTKPKEPPAPELKEPQENDPKYWDANKNFKLKEFVKDSLAFENESARQKAQAERAREQEIARQKTQEATEAAMRERIAKAGQKYSDWNEVVSKSEVRFRGGEGLENPSLRFLAKSEYGTDIAYFLAKNPKVAERIGELDPDLAVAELGKLQTQFEKPADKPAEAASKTVEPAAPAAKGAPAPITPISTSGAGSIQLDPAKMSFKELRAYERERARKR